MSSKRLNLTNCLEDFFECHAGAKVFYTYERNSRYDRNSLLDSQRYLIQVLIGIFIKLPILDKIFANKYSVDNLKGILGIHIL